jgi:hypothetical protein
MEGVFVRKATFLREYLTRNLSLKCVACRWKCKKLLSSYSRRTLVVLSSYSRRTLVVLSSYSRRTSGIGTHCRSLYLCTNRGYAMEGVHALFGGGCQLPLRP